MTADEPAMIALLQEAHELLDQAQERAIALYLDVIDHATGNSWADAHTALASHHYAHGAYRQAASHAQLALDGPPALVSSAARGRAGIMAANARDILGEPFDEDLLRASVELCVRTEQPYQAGVGLTVLAQTALGRGHQSAARSDLERSVMLFDEAGSVTGGPAALLQLAKLCMNSRQHQAARGCLDRGIQYLNKFPYAGRSARMLQDELTKLLESLKNEP